jgi:hypothetical protein
MPTLFWILLVVQAQPETQLSKQPLEQAPAKLLAGRLLFQPPAGTIEEACSRGIMSAPESGERETRLVWISGERKMVIMTYELYRSAGEDVENRIQGQVKDSSSKMEAFTTPEASLRAWAVTPSKMDTSVEAVLVMGLYLVQTDNSVQYMAFYVTPKTAEDAVGALDLARRSASTVRAGGRALAAKAGERVLRRIDENRSCRITVTDGYAMSTQQGPDFSVVTITKIVALGNRAAGIGVYFGHHPRHHYSQEEESPEVKKTPGKLLGKDVRWHTWWNKEKSSKTAETIFEADDHLQLHVFAFGADEAEVDSLLKMVDTLTIAP